VLKRAHVPILNVLYDGNTCGPFRDWQYAESQFNADPANGTNVAPGVRSCTIPATTEIETANDAGNHQGIAYYNEGDAVVLVSEMSAGWYRYISEWRFHQDGTLKPRFGMGAVQNGCTCQGHQHHVYWRFDFDVNGTDNAVFEGRRPNTFNTPLAAETKRYRLSKGYMAWLVQNPSTGDAYLVRPSANDGLALDDTTGYARGDFWLLRYRSTELDDSAVRTNTQANLDAFVNGEPTADKDIVIWYGAHINHNRGMFNRQFPHSISGPLTGGPDLVPVRW
jgi:Cu2+-containing amine oxidase